MPSTNRMRSSSKIFDDVVIRRSAASADVTVRTRAVTTCDVTTYP